MVTGDGTATGEVATSALTRLAQEIRCLRKASNLSQPELAGMIGYTRQYVSMAERVGKNLPSRELIKAIDNALGANGSLIALRQHAKAEQAALRQRASTPSPAADEREPKVCPVDRRRFLAVGGSATVDTVLASRMPVLRALEVVTSGHADSLEVATECLNELIAHYSDNLSASPPSETHGELLQVRTFAGDLLQRPGMSSRRRSDLTVATGWLSNLLAVASSYLGDHKSALVWCVDAQRWSSLSGARELAGWASLTRAMIAYYQGRTSRSIEDAVNGQKTAPAGTAIRAKLIAHEMRARARAEDHDGMVEAKRRAAEAIAKISTSVPATGVFSMALSADPPYTATSLLHLGRFHDAALAAEAVIHATYPSREGNRNRRSSNHARALLVLGLAEAGLGRVDRAVVAGRAALEGSDPVWPSMVLARKLGQALIRDHRDAAEVAEYHDVYLDVVGRIPGRPAHG